MRYSQLFGRTSRQLPKEGFDKGQKYLVQAGGLFPADGIPVLLPVGEKAWNKMLELVRYKLEKIGVQEIGFPLPLKQPVEGEAREDLTEDYLHDVLPDLLTRHVSSYRDLPVRLAKRDIITSINSPLLKADSTYSYFVYSLEEETEGQKEFGANLKEVTMQIASQLGLDDKICSYETSPEGSYRLVALTDQGEQKYFHCPDCGYTALEQLAESIYSRPPQTEEEKPMRKIHGPNLVSVYELAEFADISVYKTTKTLIFESGEADRIIAAMVRGDYDISEEKLQRVVGEEDLFLASSYTIREVFGTDVGYSGVVDLPEKVELVADLTTKGRTNFECGANETDYHLLNVNFDRDLPEPEEFYDIRKVKEGETCPRCKENELELTNGSVIARFNLNPEQKPDTSITYAGRDGKERHGSTSSFHLLPSSLFALILETHHDTNGIHWPKQITPFQAHLVSLGKGEEVREKSESIYNNLQAAGISVLWDDRNQKAGVKFNDADLLGIPIRLVIGEKSLQKGQIEWHQSENNETSFVAPDKLIDKVKLFYT